MQNEVTLIWQIDRFGSLPPLYEAKIGRSAYSILDWVTERGCDLYYAIDCEKPSLEDNGAWLGHFDSVAAAKGAAQRHAQQKEVAA